MYNADLQITQHILPIMYIGTLWKVLVDFEMIANIFHVPIRLFEAKQCYCTEILQCFNGLELNTRQVINEYIAVYFGMSIPYKKKKKTLKYALIIAFFIFEFILL